MAKVIISVSLDTGLVSELQRVSEERNKPVSHLVDEAVKGYLKRIHKSGRVATVRADDQLEESEL